MVDSIIDTYVKDSKVYQNIRADSAFQFASSYLSIDHEGVIQITEGIEDIIMSLQALEIDKKIYFDIQDFDLSEFVQDLFVRVANMCSGHFAHDTLCQYLNDCRLHRCQVAIACKVPGFYDKVNDKSSICDEVMSYLKVVS